MSFGVSVDSTAQQAGQIKSMKLLTADVGWAATDNTLFWTTDNGGHWKDITPKLSHKEQMISSVFFLDASTGWVLLKCGDDKDVLIDDVCYEFALTSNAGGDWELVHPKIVDRVPSRVITEDGQGFSGTTYLDFADAKHGWAILKRNLHVEASSGEMIRTVDGGKTWMQLPTNSLPIAEQFHFVTREEGWLSGGPDQELYVTRDAGGRWQRVEVAKPPQISGDLSPVYDLPAFTGEKHGILAVTYEGIMSNGVPVVLFRTEDGGRTWQAQMTLSEVRNTHPWAPFPSAAVGDELLTAVVSGNRITLLRAGRAGEPVSQSAEMLGLAAGADRLSFVGLQSGWILAGSSLLSTADGGASWKQIAPGGTMANPMPTPTPHKQGPRLAAWASVS